MAKKGAGFGMAGAEVKSMTFTCREMQQTEIKRFFQLEFACHSHKQQTLNEVQKFAMGKPCQKI
jgi:hypothetical protein